MASLRSHRTYGRGHSLSMMQKMLPEGHFSSAESHQDPNSTFATMPKPNLIQKAQWSIFSRRCLINFQLPLTLSSIQAKTVTAGHHELTATHVPT